MNREHSEGNFPENLLNEITEILLKNGLKATTMDDVAARLKMSKRTLYELFTSKANMVQLALGTLHKNLVEAHSQILLESNNAIEAILKCFMHHRSAMQQINADFFKDLDEFYPEERQNCSGSKEVYFTNLTNLLDIGVEEGLFRREIDFRVYCHIVAVQMELLKRAENIFPPDISLLEVYDSICIGAMRSIATSRGHEILDSLLPEFGITKQSKL